MPKHTERTRKALPKPKYRHWSKHHKKEELKKACRDKGLKITGNKQQLLQRLEKVRTFARTLRTTRKKKRIQPASLITTTRNTVTPRVMDPLESLNSLDALNTRLFSCLDGEYSRDLIENNMSQCVKAGIAKGHIKVNWRRFPLELDRVIYCGPCVECGMQLQCTLRQALLQPDYGGISFETGSEQAPVQCPQSDIDSCVGNYLTGACTGQLRFDSGEHLNHCRICKGFGVCLKDFRETHCLKCETHHNTSDSDCL